MSTNSAVASERALERVVGWIELLADGVGPRRPTSATERVAAQLLRAELRQAGVNAELESFDAYSTFGLPYGLMLGAAAVATLHPCRVAGALLAGASTAALAAEGGLVHTPVSRLLSTRESQNLVATIEPRETARRTLCLMGHLDSSRSGLMFHPSLGRLPDKLRPLLGVAAPTAMLASLGGRSRAVRAARLTSGAILASAVVLILERELRGVDVPGASDNASGSAVASQLAAESAAEPLDATRVVLLLTGCEESGLLGAQAFLRGHDTSDWLFLNFDSVGGPATIRYLLREGIVRRWPADRKLVELAEGLARRRPELGLEPAESAAGLTYDVTAVLARGGRGLSISAQDATIPYYHTPQDTVGNIEPEVLARVLDVGREMIAAIDRGEADRA